MPGILIIEDNDDDFAAITRVFSRAGLRNPVQRCSGGEQAINCLQSGDTGRPDLILLDLNMPGTDGRDVLRAVKATPGWRDIPVIVLTTSFAKEDVRRCYDAGADSYLVKPVDMEGFVRSVDRLRENRAITFELDLG